MSRRRDELAQFARRGGAAPWTEALNVTRIVSSSNWMTNPVREQAWREPSTGSRY